MRLFLAVDLPGDVRAALDAWSRSLDAKRGWRFLAPRTWHLTLRFYGEVDDAVSRELEHGVRALAERSEPFALRFGGCGAFPPKGAPRVFWVGVVEGREPLAGLAAGAEEHAVALGFEPERRPFRPHLTVARARRDGPRPRVPSDSGPPSDACGFDVQEIVLMRSHLGPEGARYEPVVRAALAGGTGGRGS